MEFQGCFNSFQERRGVKGGSGTFQVFSRVSRVFQRISEAFQKFSRSFRGVPRDFKGLPKGCYRSVPGNFEVYQGHSRDFEWRYRGVRSVSGVSKGFQERSRGFRGDPRVVKELRGYSLKQFLVGGSGEKKGRRP